MVRRNKQSGVSLVELLTVVAVMGITLGITAIYLDGADSPLQTGTVLFEGFLRQARMRAMVNTAAYRVTPVDSDFLRGEFASSCSDTSWVAEPGLTLELPQGVDFTGTDWSVCFNSRGVSPDNLTVTLSHSHYGTRQVEVLLGGTTRVIE